MRFFPGAALVIAPLALAMTPQQMLAAPRRSDAVPNPSGEWAVFTETSYSWKSHEAATTWQLLDVKTGKRSLLFDGSDVSEIFWIGSKDTSILYINGTNDDVAGGVTLYSSDVKSPSKVSLVASLPASFSGLKAIQQKSGDIHFLVNSLAYPNGTAYNEELVADPLSTARIYTDTFVRHWDTWLTPQRFALFSGVLKKSSSSYSFDGKLKNLLSGIDASVTRPETPVQPFGDAGDYDLSPDGSKVAFLSKAPEVSKQNYTTSYIFTVPFDGSSVATAINDPKLSTTPKHARGASGAPRWSPDGTTIAYFQMNSNFYESDRNQIYLAQVGGYNAVKISQIANNWDRSPDLLKWSLKGDSLYVGAPDRSNEKVFIVPTDAKPDFKPKNITQGGTTGSVVSFFIFPDDSVLVSDTSIWSSRTVYTISGKDFSKKKVLLSANEIDANLKGLKPSDVDEFYYKGNFTDIQSFIIYPEGFDKSKKYPLAFLVHGGPQVAWQNSWSSRWNLKTWADQGYVVIAPNPTGSNAFGQHLEDMITNQWGGYPYDDLVKCWEYLAHSGKFPFIDTENGIEAGASYGGFMTNWIQGHDLGRKFKALVTHDGTTSTLNQLASEEIWFMQHDFNGTLWDDRKNYEVWDPLAHAKNFATPHFVVHSSLDYRLPESEGLMLFNTLQELGVPSRFLNFPDESHWVLNRENSLVWHTEIFNWINHYTGLKVDQAIDTAQYVVSK